MLRYKTPDGKPVEAESLRGLAEALRMEMMIPDPDMEEWMLNSAYRAHMWNGSVIRTSSVEDHVRDLIEAGILTPLD